jgi:hypothetical protein
MIAIGHTLEADERKMAEQRHRLEQIDAGQPVLPRVIRERNAGADTTSSMSRELSKGSTALACVRHRAGRAAAIFLLHAVIALPS